MPDGEDRLFPGKPRSIILSRIAFDRDYSKIRLFEKPALKIIRRAFLDEFDGFEPEDLESKLKISSQLLEKGTTGEGSLSVFFQYTSVGGSGSTIYTVMAFKNIKENYFSYGLKVTTSEAGAVYLTKDYGETGHKLIVTKDRNIYEEYVQYDGHYIGNTAE